MLRGYNLSHNLCVRTRVHVRKALAITFARHTFHAIDW